MDKANKLYKYGRLTEHSESLFSTGDIWFSSPRQLNDPFECRPWFTFEGSRSQVLDTILRMLQRQRPDLTAESAKAEAVALYLKGNHRDPNVWTSVRTDAIQKLATEIGLCCLSKVPNDILMWSHYGSDHQGYCLEFEAGAGIYPFGEANPVIYSEDYPIVDFYNTPTAKQFDLIFLTKYRGWAYEQEWRVIDTKNGPGLHRYPPELLSGVIFGLRTPEPDKSKIREWVTRRGRKAQFYQCTQNESKFTIEFQVIS
jgi:hypothetical protein